MKLKYACVDTGQYGLGVSPEEYESAGVRLIRTSDIGSNSLTDATNGVFVDEPVNDRFLIQEGDLLMSRAGTIGRCFLVPQEAAGSTFAGFLVRFRPAAQSVSRYLHYAMQSQAVQDAVKSEAITSTIQNFNAERYANLDLPAHDVDEQGRIADFLDDRIGRISGMITARSEQIRELHTKAARHSFDLIRGASVMGSRKTSGLAWLGDIPSTWPVLSVNSQFAVDLGKMLDDKRQTGEDTLPYLRNTNVQWDRVDTDDLKLMDISLGERERFTVAPGDLLVCEGGQPGRAAIWDGRVSPLGYQKALHRARSRGQSRAGWLLECLRVASHLNVFAVENGQTTIGHLTNEQLREQRFPFPDPSVQDQLLAKLSDLRSDISATVQALRRSIDLLDEYKSSLITAAVNGEIDVTTAGSGVPE